MRTSHLGKRIPTAVFSPRSEYFLKSICCSWLSLRPGIWKHLILRLGSCEKESEQLSVSKQENKIRDEWNEIITFSSFCHAAFKQLKTRCANFVWSQAIKVYNGSVINETHNSYLHRKYSEKSWNFVWTVGIIFNFNGPMSIHWKSITLHFIFFLHFISDVWTALFLFFSSDSKRLSKWSAKEV